MVRNKKPRGAGLNFVLTLRYYYVMVQLALQELRFCLKLT